MLPSQSENTAHSIKSNKFSWLDYYERYYHCCLKYTHCINFQASKYENVYCQPQQLVNWKSPFIINITIPKQNVPSNKHRKNPTILCVLLCKNQVIYSLGCNACWCALLYHTMFMPCTIQIVKERVVPCTHAVKLHIIDSPNAGIDSCSFDKSRINSSASGLG